MTIAIGIIGYGALGQAVERIVSARRDCRISGILKSRAGSLEEFLRVRHDVVIECAGQAALRAQGAPVLRHGSHLVPASVGALVDDELRHALLEAAASSGVAVRIPGGAMVGIDGLAAATLVGVENVTYRGTMAPGALRNFESDIPVLTRTVAYRGTAREAVARFPKNANLTATIALAGIGFDRTRVELLVDPDVRANLHELEASGAFGEFVVRASGNRISDSSPSSRIVAGSLVQAALGSGFTRLP